MSIKQKTMLVTGALLLSGAVFGEQVIQNLEGKSALAEVRGVELIQLGTKHEAPVSKDLLNEECVKAGMTKALFKSEFRVTEVGPINTDLFCESKETATIAAEKIIVSTDRSVLITHPRISSELISDNSDLDTVCAAFGFHGTGEILKRGEATDDFISAKLGVNKKISLKMPNMVFAEALYKVTGKLPKDHISVLKCQQ